MIRIRGIYLVLLLTVLMAIGCYVKGWMVGVALWGFFALLSVGRILRGRKDGGDGKK